MMTGACVNAPINASFIDLPYPDQLNLLYILDSSSCGKPAAYLASAKKPYLDRMRLQIPTPW